MASASAKRGSGKARKARFTLGRWGNVALLVGLLAGGATHPVGAVVAADDLRSRG